MIENKMYSQETTYLCSLWESIILPTLNSHILVMLGGRSIRVGKSKTFNIIDKINMSSENLDNSTLLELLTEFIKY